MPRFCIALFIALVGAWPIEAQALAHPFAPKLSCGRLKSIVQQNGAEVISTGQFTYDRFVRDQSFCMRDEMTDPAWIVSSDQAECYVGYTCGERPSNYN